jgi:SMI1-KNR4 cell-wall
MAVDIENPGPLLTPQHLAEVEAELGTRLPDDYRAFLLKYNGGSPLPDTVAVENAPGTPTDVQVFFGIGRSIESSGLVWNKRVLADRIPEDCFPIACDSGGNIFCLTEGGRIVYIDLDSPEPGKYLVAESFDAFLQKLTE